jgi:hypothetical protein
LFDDQLTEILRQGGRTLLVKAVEAEVADFLVKHEGLKTEDGRPPSHPRHDCEISLGWSCGVVVEQGAGRRRGGQEGEGCGQQTGLGIAAGHQVRQERGHNAGTSSQGHGGAQRLASAWSSHRPAGFWCCSSPQRWPSATALAPARARWPPWRC